MSTDRSRLVSSIRRIVLTDPDLSSALDAWQNRGDQASSTGTGTSDAERDRLCCDGSTSSNPNPGADTRDTSDGGQDGLNADDPALLDSGPGSLTDVTDCATGEPICFDGNDWLPPEGWDGPTDPPIEVYYDPDKWYRVNSTETEEEVSNSCREIAEIFISLQESICGCPASGCYTVEEVCGEGAPNTTGFSCNPTGEGEMNHESCIDNFNSVCDDDPPLDTAWPEDGCTNLAIKSGTIVGSKYDPENGGTYSKPMSEIELCDEFGNSFFLSPAANGGWKTLNANQEDGYLYDSQGNKIAHIDGNEYSDPDV